MGKRDNRNRISFRAESDIAVMMNQWRKRRVNISVRINAALRLMFPVIETKEDKVLELKAEIARTTMEWDRSRNSFESLLIRLNKNKYDLEKEIIEEGSRKDVVDVIGGGYHG